MKTFFSGRNLLLFLVIILLAFMMWQCNPKNPNQPVNCLKPKAIALDNMKTTANDAVVLQFKWSPVANVDRFRFVARKTGQRDVLIDSTISGNTIRFTSKDVKHLDTLLVGVRSICREDNNAQRSSAASDADFTTLKLVLRIGPSNDPYLAEYVGVDVVFLTASSPIDTLCQNTTCEYIQFSDSLIVHKGDTIRVDPLFRQYYLPLQLVKDSLCVRNINQIMFDNFMQNQNLLVYALNSSVIDKSCDGSQNY